MKPLRTKFRSSGFYFRLIKRNRRFAMLAKRHWEGVIESFEVVRIQHKPERQMLDGRVFPACEAMPRSERWGTDGWTYPTQADAERRFKDLIGPRKPVELCPPTTQDASEVSGRVKTAVG